MQLQISDNRLHKSNKILGKTFGKNNKNADGISVFVVFNEM